MSRIRSIHPGQATDESFVSCGPWARLLAILIRNEADDHGVFEWKPLQIKMRLFPADNVNVDDLLTELTESGQVSRYQRDGRAFGIIRNFLKYQSPRRPSYVHPLPYHGEVPDNFLVKDENSGTAGASGKPTDATTRQPSGALPDNGGKSPAEGEDRRGKGVPPSPPTSTPRTPAAPRQQAAPKLNGHHPPDDVEIAGGFWRLIEKHWGGDKRKPSPKELSIARAWVQRGAKSDPVCDLMDEIMARMLRDGKPQPGGLWFFDNPVTQMLGVPP